MKKVFITWEQLRAMTARGRNRIVSRIVMITPHGYVVVAGKIR